MIGTRTFAAALLAGAVLLLGPGCGGSEGGGEAGGGEGTPTETAAPSADWVPTAEFEFPADIEFKPDEWLTATPTPIGDPRARRDVKKPFVVRFGRFPATLRTAGPNRNLAENRWMNVLQYETLMGIDSETEEFVPGLATHWKIETDEENERQTFWFRLDERARFADGSPVTSRDVCQTWWHLVQEDRQDPSNSMTFGEGFEPPEIVDRLTLKVTTKELNWRLFLYFGGFWILKADECSIPGERYLDEYNWKWLTGTGPYVMTDLKKGESVTFTRRDDWWGEDLPPNANLYNFNQIKFLNIADDELYLEKFKNDELDWYFVSRAQRWVEEFPQEEIVQKGWVKRRKVYTKAPNGISGLAMNMRKPPFDDKRVRLAFAHLFDREQLMERFFFNQYEYTDSYFPGGGWGAEEENPKIRFDPERAAELLAEAGYKERGANGFLVNAEGEPLEVTMYYGNKAWERIYLPVQASYQDAGIKFNLELLDPTTLAKKITQMQFTVYHAAYSGLLFPNPETSFRSDLADKTNNNNITGYKNERVDELLQRYNVTFDRAEQKAIIREADRLIFDEYPYALGWYGPYKRVLFWDRLGHPEKYFTRIGSYAQEMICALWWFDPDKEAALDAARKANESLPQGEVVVKPWDK